MGVSAPAILKSTRSRADINGMSCPACRRHSLVVIEMRVGEAVVTMRSCSACDTRIWDRDGRQVALDEVLTLTAARR